MVQLNLIQATVYGWKKRSQNCLNSEYLRRFALYKCKLLLLLLLLIIIIILAYMVINSQRYIFGSQTTVFGKWSFSLDLYLDFIIEKLSCTIQAPVVQTLDSTIYWINPYSLDNKIGFPNTNLLDSDLSGRQHYPMFEQPGPGLQFTNIYCNFEPIG